MSTRSLCIVLVAFLTSFQRLAPSEELVPRTYLMIGSGPDEHRLVMRTNGIPDVVMRFFAVPTSFIKHDLIMFMTTVFGKLEIFDQKTGQRWARRSQHVQMPDMPFSSPWQVSK